MVNGLEIWKQAAYVVDFSLRCFESAVTASTGMRSFTEMIETAKRM